MSTQQPQDITTINPATGAVIARYAVDGAAQVEALVSQADAGFKAWRAVPVERRAEVLHRLSAVLRDDLDHLAGLITAEMGKTIGEARAEVTKCAGLASWFAEHGPAMLADEPAPVEGGQVYVSYLPVGTVLGIMPWNFPLWQVLRAAVPITLGGNAFLLKHAPNVLGCAYALRDAFAETGAPPGLLGVVNVGNDATDALLRDPRIAAVTLTGSVGAGAAVAALAAKAVKN